MKKKVKSIIAVSTAMICAVGFIVYAISVQVSSKNKDENNIEEKYSLTSVGYSEGSTAKADISTEEDGYSDFITYGYELPDGGIIEEIYINPAGR